MRTRTILASGLLAAIGASASAAPLTTTFTYQGVLENNGAPANGVYDLRFQLTDASTLGILLQTIEFNDVPVSDGIFTVQLTFDTAHFAGEQRWVAVGVRDGASAGAYTSLNPRQPLHAAPFAIYAMKPWLKNAGNNNIYYDLGRVGINTTSPQGMLGVVSNGINGIHVENPTSTGFTDSGVVGIAPDFGGNFSATGTSGITAGVRGTAAAGSAQNYGVWGSASSTHADSAGVIGTHTAGIGVAGQSATGEGVFGLLTGTSGNAGRFEATNSSHNGDAVYVTKTGGGRCMQLFVADGDQAQPLYAVTYGPARAASFEAHDSNTVSAVSILKNNGPALTVFGSVGSSDLPSLTAPVSIMGGDDASLTADGYLMLGGRTGANIVIDNNEIVARNNGAASSLTLNNNGGNVVIAPQGTTSVRVLEISGADVAERFPCSEQTEPGTVMELDPENPGQLRISRCGYSKRVAGIVSGAGDLPAGAILGNLPGQEKNPPIAMSGRVWAKCDASNSAIEVGDLLTTSATPGHAMKAIDDSRSHGAVLGKAMTTLEAGKQGLVLVLVNLH